MGFIKFLIIQMNNLWLQSDIVEVCTLNLIHSRYQAEESIPLVLKNYFEDKKKQKH